MTVKIAMLYILCLSLVPSPIYASPRAHHGVTRSLFGWTKHPAHWVAHHKLTLISVVALYGSMAAYAQTELDMQNRCPLCLSEGQAHAYNAAGQYAKYLSIGTIFVAADCYSYSHFKSTSARALTLGMTGNASFWASWFAYRNTQINSLTEFQRYRNSFHTVPKWRP